MPKQSRSLKEIEEVKEKILDKALNILVEDGFENLSMHRLGARLKMTAANLYNYYGGKDELLIAIHKKTFGMLYDMIYQAVSEARNPLEKINKLVMCYVRFGLSYPAFYDIMFNRRVMQFSDYVGTDVEAISYDEYQSSLKSLLLAFGIVEEYLMSLPNYADVDVKYLTIRTLAELHGVISLHNSHILQEMIDTPEDMIEKIKGDIVESLSRGR